MGLGLPTIVMHDGGGLVEHVIHEQTGIVAQDVDDVAEWIIASRRIPSWHSRLGRGGGSESARRTPLNAW